MGKLLDSLGFKIGLVIFFFVVALGANWFFNGQDELKPVFDKNITLDVEKIEIKSDGVKQPITSLIQEAVREEYESLLADKQTKGIS